MGLGHNDPWVESHIRPQQMWGQRSSRGQWPLVQVFAKTVTVSTYFDVCSGETCGSRTTCYLKNRKNMQFLLDFLLNMLENDHSNLQTKFGVHITSNIFKIIQFQNHGIVPTPDLPTLKAYPTPVEGGGFEEKGWTWGYPEQFCSLAVHFWPSGKNCLGVVATPLWRTRVKCELDEPWLHWICKHYGDITQTVHSECIMQPCLHWGRLTLPRKEKKIWTTPLENSPNTFKPPYTTWISSNSA